MSPARGGGQPIALVDLDVGAILNGSTNTWGPFDLRSLINGQLCGSLATDATGTGAFTILQERRAGEGGLEFVVPQDVAHPDTQHPFLVKIFQPWVTFTWVATANSAFLRPYIAAIPQ